MQTLARASMLLVFGSASAWSQPAWRVACPFDSTKALLPVTCGRLKVPENPASPGRVVEIAFMQVKAPRNIDQHGPIVYVNGGPGQNSLYWAEQLVTVPHIRDVVVDRDWIFFDQRGTGRSSPSLYCADDADWLTQVRKCRDRLVAQGIDVSQYNSERIVGDLEALRLALGVRQWTVWGLSYGSRVAAIAARMHPTSVRGIILDAGGIPEGEELVEDARGTEVAITKLFTKCANDAACAGAYPDLRTRFIAALPRLRQQPLQAGDRRYDDGALLRYVRGWLYPRGNSTFETRIQGLLKIMDAAARGDGPTLAATRQRMRDEEGIDTRRDPPLPDHGRYSTGQNLSVYCHESEPFRSLQETQRAAARSEMLRALVPPFGTDSACIIWRAGRADTTVRTRVYDGPQLVFTGELDASSSGIKGYQITMVNANARQVVFRNGMHGQLPSFLPTPEDTEYRLCALRLARAFVVDPRAHLDTRCAETRQLRLVR